MRRVARREETGFTLVETLVALVIVTAAIIAVSSGYKAYADARARQAFYRDLYVTGLSLREYVSSLDLADDGAGSGTLNGFDYEFDSDLVEARRNYELEEDIMGVSLPGGNTGQWEMRLYKVSMTLSRGNLTREYAFYVTDWKNLGSRIGVSG